MHLEERVELYNTHPKFSKYPKMIYDKNWMLGIWSIGNNYKNNSSYYGAYPRDYLDRIMTLFPDKKKILHLFSGSLPAGDYIRFDRKKEPIQGVYPEVIGEAEKLSDYFYNKEQDIYEQFDLILADPPYSEEDAKKYGTCLISRNKVIKECVKILKKGGHLMWMDQTLPMYRKDELKRCIEIYISRSTNHRVRAVFGWEKL